MRLKDRISELTKDYIVFPDLLYGLSSANNEPLRDVVKYLDCKGFDTLNVFSSGPRYEMFPNLDSQEIIHDFLENIMDAMPEDNLDWVLTDSDSLDGLTVEEEQRLIKLFNKGATTYFKVSELLSFEPLNGLLHFVDVEHTVKDESVENPIDRLVEEQHKKYIALNKFVNDLRKSESFGAGHPLKITVKYILENIPLNEVSLYKVEGTSYLLVSEADDFEYKNAFEILLSVYDTLDDYQTGTVKADREPFKDFYFKYSEVEHIGVSGSKVVEKEQLVYIDKQLSTSDRKLLEGSSIINNLGENQRLLITYPSFVEEEIACLIIDENPACISHNDNYLRHSRMISKAISGGLLIPDDEGQILAEQVKIWLASHNFIYKGFNDGTPTIDQLLKENTKLRANTKLKACQPQQNDEIREQTIEKLKKMAADYEELSLKYESINTQNKELLDKTGQYKQDNSEVLTQHWEAESKKYKSKIEELEAVIKEFSDVEILSQDGDWQLYNWKAMDQNQYPPELHLAIEIWKEYYRAEDIGDITQFNTARFNRIAIEVNLNKGNLKNRIRSILTPLNSKKIAPDLLAALRGIDIIYNDKMAD